MLATLAQPLKGIRGMHKLLIQNMHAYKNLKDKTDIGDPSIHYRSNKSCAFNLKKLVYTSNKSPRSGAFAHKTTG